MICGLHFLHGVITFVYHLTVAQTCFKRNVGIIKIVNTLVYEAQPTTLIIEIISFNKVLDDKHLTYIV